jgi:hypothetical protein
MTGPGRVFCALLASAVFSTAQPMQIRYTWDDPGTAGWTNHSAAAELSNPGGYLKLRFAEQDAPFSAACIARGPIPGGMRVTNLSVRVLAEEQPPSALRLVLHALGPDRFWQCVLDAPPAGVWTEYAVPVDFTAGWSIGPVSAAAVFGADREWLNWVGLYARRGGMRSEANIRIDDFRVSGVLDTGLDRDRDAMPDHWEWTYGLNPDMNDAAGDRDEDGLANIGEYAADTRPDSEASRLAIMRVEEPAPEELYLEWIGGTAATQYVEWTDTLDGAWRALFTNRPPTTTTNLLLDAPGPVNFFRIRAARP